MSSTTPTEVEATPEQKERVEKKEEEFRGGFIVRAPSKVITPLFENMTEGVFFANPSAGIRHLATGTIIGDPSDGGWIRRIKHAFPINHRLRAYTGANVAFGANGTLVMTRDICLMPGDRTEILVNYGYGYWQEKLFPLASPSYAYMTGRNQVGMRSLLYVLVPNNRLTLQPEDQLRSALYWSTRCKH